MLVPNQIVEVVIGGRNINHYRNLGYDVNIGDAINVKAENLTCGSHVEVDIECDICHKIFQRSYKSYLLHHTYGIDTCNKCKGTKSAQTCLDKYGVENVFQVEEFKEKHRQTCKKKYGYEYISQVPDIREEIVNSFLLKYGFNSPMKNDIIKNKAVQTNIEKYGVPNVMQNKDFVNKAQQTNLKKYGYKCPLQNPDIKAKAINTLYENGSVPTSSQQLTLYEIIKNKYKNAELNYPFSNCSLDIFICINDIKIDIEYDGSYWHQDQQADIRRDKFLQSCGVKVLRIRSGHKIPTQEELFSAIDELVETDWMFKEIILSDWQQFKINENKEVSA